MPTPRPPPQIQAQQAEEVPNTVIAAKKVDLALVTYRDDRNILQTQLVIVGDNNVSLIESRALGISSNTNPQGPASEWLRKGIFKALGRPEKVEEVKEKKS